MAQRKVFKEKDVQTLKAIVLTSDGSEEVVSVDGYSIFIGGLYICNAEYLFTYRLKNNCIFKTESGKEILSRHIVKVINKEITSKIIKYNEVYEKFLIFPEEFSHYEELN